MTQGNLFPYRSMASGNYVSGNNMMQQSLQSSMGNMALHNTGVAQAMMPGNIHGHDIQQLPQSQQFQLQQFLSQQFQQQFQQLQQQLGSQAGPARQESTATSGVSNKNNERTGHHNDRDVASGGEDDTPRKMQDKLPPTKTCTHFDDALNHNSNTSRDRIEFIKNSTYVHEKALPREWTPSSGEIKKGNVLKLPGGRKVTIQGKLGSGAFGAVYLVKLDDQSESYALKVQRSVSGMTDSLSFECETQWDLDYKLHNLLGYDPVPRPIELHRFSNGSLFFMTAVDGKTLHDIMTAHKMKYKKTPEDVVALIALEMLKLFDLLHRKGNILVRRMSSHTK